MPTGCLKVRNGSNPAAQAKRPVSLFAFFKSVIDGSAPTDSITGFTTNDAAILSGYGSAAAVAAISSATAVGGNTTGQLSDNTKIEFVGCTGSLTGHRFSD